MSNYNFLFFKSGLTSLLLWLVFVLLFSLTSYADEIEETVVTGTRSAKELELSPVKVEVVTQKSIDKRHAKNLKEALIDIPGLSFKDIRGRQGSELWIQGIDAKRVKILIDHEPVTGAKNGGFDLEQIGIADIEKIEIVKGATSALYGSDAIGGVVNIITQVPDKKFQYKLRADVGSHGEQNPGGKAARHSQRHLSAAIASAFEHGYLQLNANINEKEGFQLTPTGSVEEVWSQNGPSGQRENYGVKAGWYVNDNFEVYLGSNFYQQDVAYRFWLVKIPFIKTELAKRLRNRIGFNYLINEQHDISVKYYKEDYKEDALEDSQYTAEIVSQREGTIKDERLSLQWNYMLSDLLSLNSGMEHYREYVDLFVTKWDARNRVYVRESEIFQLGVNGAPDIAINSAERDGTEVFLQLDSQLGNWQVLPGIRWQKDSKFGEQSTVKINARYDISSFSDCTTLLCNRQFLRFGLGQGYRAPNVQELYYRFNNPESGYKVYGNSGLLPEQSSSYQLAWHIAWRNERGDSASLPWLSKAHIEAGLFRNDVDKLIATALISSGGLAEESIDEYRYQNIDQARIQGFEISSGFKLKQQLLFNFSYTYLHAKDVLSGNYLPRRAKNQFKASILFEPQARGFSAGVYWRAQSKEYLTLNNSLESPKWQTFDLKINQAFKERITIFAGVNNMFSEQRDFNGRDFRPKEARYIYIGFKLSN